MPFKRTLKRYRPWPGTEVYLELHANRTEWKLDNPNVGDDEFADLWGMIVREAMFDFEQRTKTKVYLHGRSNRHVCVEDTPANSRNYQWLRRVALQLEQSAIDSFNSAEPITE